MIETLNREVEELRTAQERLAKRQRWLEEAVYCLETLGLTGCLWYDASLEDWTQFDCASLDFTGTEPVVLNPDRRWTGFPELNEFDHLQDYILPVFYRFPAKQPG